MIKLLVLSVNLLLDKDQLISKILEFINGIGIIKIINSGVLDHYSIKLLMVKDVIKEIQCQEVYI